MPRILSGIQPSGTLHIGNYFGALTQWVALQQDNDCLYCVVDLHAITVPYDPKRLQERVFDAALDFLAAGVDPKRSIIFVQSRIPEHTELMWFLNTLTPFGEVERMTQWKEKVKVGQEEFEKELRSDPTFKEYQSQMRQLAIDALIENKKGKGNEQSYKQIFENSFNEYKRSFEFKTFINYLTELHKEKTIRKSRAGLLNYPILQAADILLYKTNIVPVGEDQQQHIEFARSLAKKFNNTFGITFPEPQPKLTKTKRVMSLTDPTRKMSKSDGDKSYIALTDSAAAIKTKLAKAVTATKGGGDNPGAQNLIMILREMDAKLAAQYETAEAGGSIRYADLKADLATALADHLAPFQNRRAEFAAKPKTVKKILDDGAAAARAIAQATMTEVRKKMGLRP